MSPGKDRARLKQGGEKAGEPPRIRSQRIYFYNLIRAANDLFQVLNLLLAEQAEPAYKQ